jgi:hypothetical protein
MNDFQIGLAEPSASRMGRTNGFIARRWPECLALAAYAGLVAFTIPYHEPWGDEAQAWQLVRSAPLSEVFRTYLRYEGHPGLWHLILSGLIHLGVSYRALPWVCAVFALAGESLLVFFAPFPRYIRLALPFTFFLAYQYAVVARGYVFVPLLLFMIAVVWKRSPILIAVLLGLLGSLALHALAISGGLALLYLLERRRDGTLHPRRPLLLAGAILLAFYCFTAWTVWPPHDLYVHRPEMNDSIFIRVAVEFARGVVSLAMGLLDPMLLGIPLWILLWRRFRRRQQAIYLLPVGTLSLFSSQYLQNWHAGLIVPTLITAFWLANEAPHADTPAPRWETIAIGALLAYVFICQIAWTGYAVAFDYANPYSPDLATARYLAPRIEAGDKIAVTYFEPSTSKAFFSVGLEPYFRPNIFMNRSHLFWFFSTNDQTEASFFGALEQHPPIVIVEYDKYLLPPRFDAARDVSGAKAELLHRNGYALTHVFCGEQPFHLHTREQVCHLIFEPKP